MSRRNCWMAAVIAAASSGVAAPRVSSMRGRAGCCLPLRLTPLRLPARESLRSGRGRGKRLHPRRRARRDLARGGDRARAPRLRRARQRTVGDAAQDVPRRAPEGRLPRDAGQGRRHRDPQVGHLVPRQPGGRPPGREGRDLRLVARGRRAAGAGGRARGHRAAHRRGGGRGRSGAGTRRRAHAGIVGCGLHGTWAARCLAEAEYGPGVCFDPDPDAAGRLAGELGWEVGRARRRARLRRRDLRDPGRRAGGPRGATCARACTSTCWAPTAPARPRPSRPRWPAASSSATSGSRPRTAASSPARWRPGWWSGAPSRELGYVLTGAAAGPLGPGGGHALRQHRARDPGPRHLPGAARGGARRAAPGADRQPVGSPRWRGKSGRARSPRPLGG